MSAFLDKLLSYLPFNGDKTKIGMILAIIQIVQNVVADPQWGSLLTDISTKQWIPAAIIIVGLIHKYVKTDATK